MSPKGSNCRARRATLCLYGLWPLEQDDQQDDTPHHETKCDCSLSYSGTGEAFREAPDARRTLAVIVSARL